MERNEKIQDAEYKSQPIEEYSGNPLIEALPAFMAGKTDRAIALTSRNRVTEADRTLPPSLRSVKLDNIAKIFVPTNWALSVTATVDLQIRAGLRRRDPFSNDAMRVAYQAGIGGFGSLPDLNDPVGCVFLTGNSGMGKTTTLARHMGSYPQVIRHREYQGIQLDLLQITYIYVNAPHDGTVKGFCLGILSEIDRCLGTDYVRKANRASVASLSELIARLCAMYSVGIIIVDECQNLLYTHYGQNRLSEFLNSLSNKTGTPFLFVGTPAALALLDGSFHLCRRLESKGAYRLQPYAADSPDWRNLVATLWRDGVYTNVERPLTPELQETLHTCSGGVPAILKQLLYETQKVLFDREPEEELITPELVREVAEERFPQTQANLAAVRESNLTRIRDMGDWSDGKVGRGNPKPKKQRKPHKGNKRVEIEETALLLLKERGLAEEKDGEELKGIVARIADSIDPTAKREEWMKAVEEAIREVPDSRPAPKPAEPGDLEEDVADADHIV